MAETGYPGKKTAVGGVNQEQLEFEAHQAADEAVGGHEIATDPHPQYTTDAEVIAMLPRFVKYWKFGI